jgi:hypothetical protein
MDKKLFEGTFNISGMPITMHTQAINSDKACQNFISKLSKHYNLARHYYLSMFDGSIDNYLIQEVFNYGETDRIKKSSKEPQGKVVL